MRIMGKAAARMVKHQNYGGYIERNLARKKWLHLCNHLFILVGCAGIEPATNGLREVEFKFNIICNQLLAMLAAFQNSANTTQSNLIQCRHGTNMAQSGRKPVCFLIRTRASLLCQLNCYSLALPVCNHAFTSAQHLWLLNYRSMSIIVRSWLLNHYLNTIPTCAMRRNISAPCVPVCFPRLRLKASKKLRNAHLPPRATSNPQKPANCWPSPLSRIPRSSARSRAPCLRAQRKSMSRASCP